MNKIREIHIIDIDISFDFTTDCMYWDGFWSRNAGLGSGKSDPDSKSPTLRKYHQALWSKPLPNGNNFYLEFGGSSDYLKYKDIRLSSDSITASFRYNKYRWMIEKVMNEVPDYRNWMEQVIRQTYTIGGTIIFPVHPRSMNGMRGMNPKICDRWDLTLECIRRYYSGIIDTDQNPLGKVLESDRFFSICLKFLRDILISSSCKIA